MLLAFKDNSNDILYSSQQEIKAVVRSYTLMHNEELNSTYLNTKVTKHTHVDTLVNVSITKSRNTHRYILLDINLLSLNLCITITSISITRQ